MSRLSHMVAIYRYDKNWNNNLNVNVNRPWLWGHTPRIVPKVKQYHHKATNCIPNIIDLAQAFHVERTGEKKLNIENNINCQSQQTVTVRTYTWNSSKSKTISSQGNFISIILLWKYLFSWVPIFVDLGKCSCSWILDFVVLLSLPYNSWGNLPFVGNKFRGLLQPQKPRKLVPHKQKYFHSIDLAKGFMLNKLEKKNFFFKLLMPLLESLFRSLTFRDFGPRRDKTQIQRRINWNFFL